jgi:SAM-dependent methyltransferase
MPLLLKALLIQLLALGLVFLLALSLPLGTWWPWLQGGLAASLSIGFGLPPWWWLIQGLFLPLAMLLLQAGIHPLWYLLGLLALLLLFPGAFKDRVPLYLTSRQTLEKVLELLPQQRQAQFLDLGCGGGQLLVELAKARPDMVFHGVESSPLLFLLARWRLRSQPGCRVFFGSFWTMDLDHYDLVYAFLSPAPMERLWNWASGSMKPGSRLVSNSFAIPGHPADVSYALNNGPETELLVWNIKAEVGADG